MSKPALLSLLCLAFACAAVVASEHPWPQFRGPDGNGVANADGVPTRWSESENIAWKTPLPGKGWSSPVLAANGKIWLTTAVEVFPTDEEREKLLIASGQDPKQFKVRQVARRIDLKALEVDWQTGKLERTIDLLSIDTPDPIHSFNSYSSPTPVLDGNRLFTHFGAFGTVCVDVENGAVLWQKRFSLEHSVGPGSSPFFQDDFLVLICDGVDAQFVAALDKQSGETVWKTSRPKMRAPDGEQKKSFCTPIFLTEKSGRRQLVCMGAQWLVSYELETGKEIWRLDHGNGFSVVPRPVYHDDLGLLFICTGFGKPELWAIDPDASGDITGSDKVVWTETKRIPEKAEPLLADGLLFVISDGGVATCFDAATGEIHWTERISGNYSASPLLAGGRIYFCSEEGKTTLIDAGKEFRVIAENHLDGQLMASPLAQDGALLIRSDTALYRLK